MNAPLRLRALGLLCGAAGLLLFSSCADRHPVGPGEAGPLTNLIVGDATPTIDGTIGTEEWAGATCFDFQAPLTSGGTTPARFCLQHDASNVYWSLRSGRPWNNGGDVLRIFLRTNTEATLWDEIRWQQQYTGGDRHRNRSDGFTGSVQDAIHNGIVVRSGSGGFTSFEGSKPRADDENGHDVELQGTIEFRLVIQQGSDETSYPANDWAQYDFGAQPPANDPRQRVVVTLNKPGLVTVADHLTGEYWTKVTESNVATFYFHELDKRELIVHARNLKQFAFKGLSGGEPCLVGGYYFVLSPHDEDCYLETGDTEGSDDVGTLYVPGQSLVALTPAHYSRALNPANTDYRVVLPGDEGSVANVSINLLGNGVKFVANQIRDPFTWQPLTIELTGTGAAGENVFGVLPFGNLAYQPQLPPGLEYLGYKPKGILHAVTSIRNSSPSKFAMSGLPAGLQAKLESNQLKANGKLWQLLIDTNGQNQVLDYVYAEPATSGESTLTEPCNDSKDEREVCDVATGTGANGEMVVIADWKGAKFQKRNNHNETKLLLEVRYTDAAGKSQSIQATAICTGTTTEYRCTVHEVQPSNRAGMVTIGGHGAGSPAAAAAGKAIWEIRLPTGVTQATWQIRVGDAPSWVDFAPNSGFRQWIQSFDNTWITPG